ncbi:hypothetical protein H696_05514 [Fonticula alba]|uniref:Chromodomain-helicase-DNA-binding protein 1 n=1 Tax=Fonticula alba TaxID=691883 RepID=A0A058Z2A6_FONAL|nr:hypothetical protein H696_05514 [Fonticula alba]KCV68048.1 hypothetical protein H696_05514 [Fonticula alba]|eukprot:XP_009497615.1 hypothetical protein H696_05514 [Fonticula alba]
MSYSAGSYNDDDDVFLTSDASPPASSSDGEDFTPSGSSSSEGDDSGSDYEAGPAARRRKPATPASRPAAARAAPSSATRFGGFSSSSASPSPSGSPASTASVTSPLHLNNLSAFAYRPPGASGAGFGGPRSVAPAMSVAAPVAAPAASATGGGRIRARGRLQLDGDFDEDDQEIIASGRGGSGRRSAAAAVAADPDDFPWEDFADNRRRSSRRAATATRAIPSGRSIYADDGGAAFDDDDNFIVDDDDPVQFASDDDDDAFLDDGEDSGEEYTLKGPRRRAAASSRRKSSSAGAGRKRSASGGTSSRGSRRSLAGSRGGDHDDLIEPQPESYGRVSRVRTSRLSSTLGSDEDDEGPTWSNRKRIAGLSRRSSSRAASAPVYSYAEADDDTDLMDEDEIQERQAAAEQQAYYEPEEEPEPEDAIDRVCDVRKTERDGIEVNEYLIKWQGFSHLHNTWELAQDMLGSREAAMSLGLSVLPRTAREQGTPVKGYKRMENYIRRRQVQERSLAALSAEELEQARIDEEMERHLLREHCRVERVVSVRTDDLGEPEYFCKWRGLPYAECTWEAAALVAKDFAAEIADFEQRYRSLRVPSRSQSIRNQRMEFTPITEQPSYIVGGELRDYQVMGLNFLASAWSRNTNVILADEMGLGKTCQTICMLSYLFHSRNIYGPFLLVVPLSTIDAWQNELRRWAPAMNAILYLGNAKSREVIRQYEFYEEGSNDPSAPRFNVLLTTFDMVLRDFAYLSPIRWAYLGVDEAHRLKNSESQLYEHLISLNTANRLLITGTPLQNAIRELWALLQFLQPTKFTSLEEFEATYGRFEEADQLRELHETLRPHMLRRLKRQVLKSLPSKVERILRVEMSPKQKLFYEWILARNYTALAQGNKASQTSLQNILIELKKLCNHPNLTNPEAAHAEGQEILSSGAADAREQYLKNMITSCGKMVLLDKLLVRLREGGHRVLIFSQMVRMLDIIEEYLRLKGFGFQRLDGGTSSEQRKQAMDHFNAEGSADFCFLLSTRAGGLGINLATADTVILYDSDWNPQNDLQAMARAHRLGQKNVVNIYRFVTKNTVEEDIIERAKRKMVLDHLVIQRLDASGNTILSKSGSGSQPNFTKSDIQQILKFGAQDLFKSRKKDGANPDDMPDSSMEAHPPQEDIDLDDVLARAETRDAEAAAEDDSGASELLNSFQVADFEWDSIIPEEDRQRAAQEEKERQVRESLGYTGDNAGNAVMVDGVLVLPPRRRRRRLPGGALRDPHGVDAGDSDEDYEDDYSSGVSGSSSSLGGGFGRGGAGARRTESIITDRNIRNAHRALRKFGWSMMTSSFSAESTYGGEDMTGDTARAHDAQFLALVTEEANLGKFDNTQIRDLFEMIVSRCTTAQLAGERERELERERLLEAGARPPKLPAAGAAIQVDIHGVSLNATDTVARIRDLATLRQLVRRHANDTDFRLKGLITTSRPTWDHPWTDKDDSMLLVGVLRHGYGHWEPIRLDPSLGLAKKIVGRDQTAEAEAAGRAAPTPGFRHVMKRTDYLFRQIRRREDEMSNGGGGADVGSPSELSSGTASPAPTATRSGRQSSRAAAAAAAAASRAAKADPPGPQPTLKLKISGKTLSSAAAAAAAAAATATATTSTTMTPAATAGGAGAGAAMGDDGPAGGEEGHFDGGKSSGGSPGSGASSSADAIAEDAEWIACEQALGDVLGHVAQIANARDIADQAKVLAVVRTALQAIGERVDEVESRRKLGLRPVRGGQTFPRREQMWAFVARTIDQSDYDAGMLSSLYAKLAKKRPATPQRSAARPVGIGAGADSQASQHQQQHPVSIGGGTTNSRQTQTRLTLTLKTDGSGASPTTAGGRKRDLAELGADDARFSPSRKSHRSQGPASSSSSSSSSSGRRSGASGGGGGSSSRPGARGSSDDLDYDHHHRDHRDRDRDRDHQHYRPGSRSPSPDAARYHRGDRDHHRDHHYREHRGDRDHHRDHAGRRSPPPSSLSSSRRGSRSDDDLY